MNTTAKLEGWPCACVKRDAQGALTAIKVHSYSVKRCRTCGAERPELGKYYCSGCGKLLDRDSDKVWLTSYCTKCERSVRCYRV